MGKTIEIEQCKKQTTVAIIMKDGRFISIGFNSINNKVIECLRGNMKSGEGYELCKSICNQNHHAEVEACLNAGLMDARGATLYLIGHTYCCDDCKKVMKQYNIKNIIIC